MFKKCLNLSFFERSFPAKNRKPYPNFFQHLVLPIKGRIECGKQKIYVYQLIEIADILETSVSYLIGESEE